MVARRRVSISQSSALKLSSSKHGKSTEIHRVAHYAFFAGLVVSILAAFFRTYVSTQVLVTTLVALGLLVGLFNLTAKETQPFLLAAVALMLAGIVNLGIIPVLGPWLQQALVNIVVFVVPGAIILGLKSVWKMASN